MPGIFIQKHAQKILTTHLDLVFMFLAISHFTFPLDWKKLLFFWLKIARLDLDKNLTWNICTLPYVLQYILYVKLFKNLFFFILKTCCNSHLVTLCGCHRFCKKISFKIENLRKLLINFQALCIVWKPEFCTLYSWPLLGNPINTC
jgi:hypothetical protein